MGVPGLWDVSTLSVFRFKLTFTSYRFFVPRKSRSRTYLAVVDGFEALRTLFFRCARLMSVPFLPLFIFDGPMRPKVKRGKGIPGEKHWPVDSMKGMLEAFGILTCLCGLFSFVMMPPGPTQTKAWFRPNGWFTER